MRLTKALFYLSDGCAWLLVGFATLLAISYPFLSPIVAKSDGLSISPIKIAATTLIFAAVAFGAWRLTQRKPWGLIAVSLPATLGNPSFATLYLFFIALIFGAPLMLALIESRYHRSKT